MVEEDNVRLEAAEVRAINGFGVVLEAGLHEAFYYVGFFRTHAVLLGERSVWIICYHKTLKEGLIQVVPIAFLNCQSVIVDFWPELLMVADQDEVFRVGRESCENVAFEDFASFFNEDDSGSGV